MDQSEIFYTKVLTFAIYEIAIEQNNIEKEYIHMKEENGHIEQLTYMV